MSEVTEIIDAATTGQPGEASQLLPIVYEELRRLAAQHLSQERPGQTLQPTALVHEAYLRLVDVEHAQRWKTAPTSSPRRPKRCGGSFSIEPATRSGSSAAATAQRVDLDQIEAAARFRRRAIDRARRSAGRLAAEDPVAAELVKLRFFAGLTLREAAELIGLPQRTAEREWAYARAWLFDELSDSDNSSAR